MLIKAQPTAQPQLDTTREWVTAVGRAALAAAWAAQRPGNTERFLPPAQTSQLSRTWVQTADYWELPLWHRTAPSHTDAAPVVLAVGPDMRSGCLDLTPERSLVNALHHAGHDVYLFSHRGDPEARPPAQAHGFDFDDMVAKDLQATIDAIRQRTGAKRVLFVGHGLGGLLFVAHLARVGTGELAGGVVLNTPVQFSHTSSRSREVHRVASLLPPHWTIPHRAIQRVLLASGRDATIRQYTHQVDGPTLRRMALDQTADLSTGLMRQIARWHQTGRLCDRDDRFDDLCALQGRRFPLLSICADDDPTCTPDAARPLTDALEGSRFEALQGGWGHLDTIASELATREVFPRITQWLDQHRRRCWDQDMMST